MNKISKSEKFKDSLKSYKKIERGYLNKDINFFDLKRLSCGSSVL